MHTLIGATILFSGYPYAYIYTLWACCRKPIIVIVHTTIIYLLAESTTRPVYTSSMVMILVVPLVCGKTVQLGVLIGLCILHVLINMQ